MPEDIPEPAQEPAQEGAAEVTYETLGDLVPRFHDHTQAIPVHRIQTTEGIQREQGRRIVGVEASITHEEVEELIACRVAEEMEDREVARNLEALNENEEEQEGENGGFYMDKYKYVLNVDYASNEMSNGNMENYEILNIALNHKNVAIAKILQRLEPRFALGDDSQFITEQLPG
nr:hypothetical protein [Tanacetum cinerariifolium]